MNDTPMEPLWKEEISTKLNSQLPGIIITIHWLKILGIFILKQVKVMQYLYQANSSHNCTNYGGLFKCISIFKNIEL